MNLSPTPEPYHLLPFKGGRHLAAGNLEFRPGPVACWLHDTGQAP